MSSLFFVLQQYKRALFYLKVKLDRIFQLLAEVLYGEEAKANLVNIVNAGMKLDLEAKQPLMSADFKNIIDNPQEDMVIIIRK